MEVDIKRLMSERDIYAVQTRYTRGVDRIDLEMVRSCYQPDATDDHGEYVGDVDGFIRWLEVILPSLEISQHFIGNFSVDVRGDKAFSETYVHSHTRFGDENGNKCNRIRCVRFYDWLERRDGGPWLIANRHVVFDWAQTSRIEGETWGSHPRRSASQVAGVPGLVGTNAREDPSNEWATRWKADTGSTTPWLVG